MDKPGSKHAASISSDRLPYLPGCFPLLRSLREHRIQSPYQPRGCIRLVADYFAPREDGRARSDGEGDREGSENRVFRRESLVEIKCGNGKVRVV